MSVFLEPESLRPFLGGTYFPPEDRHGRRGFPSVLRLVAEWWDTRRPEILTQSEQVADGVIRASRLRMDPVPVGGPQVRNALDLLLASYDPQDGGFVPSPQRAPKFPVAPTLEFLMGAGWEDEQVRAALVHTLMRAVLRRGLAPCLDD